MLTKEKILELFEKMNDELKKQNDRGEIGLVGGAVMCLVYNARASTKDVDGIFHPTAVIRKIAKVIAAQEGLPPDWLNDAAKGYLKPNFVRQEVLNLSNLQVWAPEGQYMLAMKCLSARFDTSDKDDIIFLIKYLKLKHAKSVFILIESYYPKNQIPAKTQYFIEEVFEVNARL